MQLSASDIAFQLPPDPTARRITIGVILPDGADPFYQQVYRGLLIPARALDNVTLKVRSGNNDPIRMIQELDWLVSAKVDAILLSPIDNLELLSAIDRVVRSGTPLVTLGLPLRIDKIISQISFDDYAAGYKAGEYLCAALGGKGTIVDIYDSAKPEKETARSGGLQDYQRENCPGMKIITQVLPAGSEPACQGLQGFLSTSGPVAGIFAHSDELGLCAVDSSKAGFVIGIGASAEAIQSIKAGKLSATLGQYPYEMGQIAMETTIEYLYGKPVEPNKPFPVNLITKDSLK
jgi:ribose transport system substrate-binding protein